MSARSAAMEKIAPERYADVNGETSMAAEPIRRLFTTDEYHAMAESGILSEDDRVELIEGEIWQMSPIKERHFAGVTRLDYLFKGGLGVAAATVATQNPVYFDERSEPQPDVLVLRFRTDFYAERLPIPSDVFLLVEVSDTTVDYDRRVKVPFYGSHDIPEAWLVDLNRSILEVYRGPSPQGYREVLTLRRGDQISPLAFPDLQLPVDAILG
jgi:Uma2 family endonuclease